MSMTETYEELIKSLARHVGVDADALAKTQEIVVDSLAIGMVFEGDDDFGDVVYFSDLGAPAGPRVPEVYKVLLQANNLWAGTGGATLGLQQDTGNIILAGRMDLDGLSAEGLAQLLDAFADTALFWKKFVADELPSGDASSFAFATRA